MSYSTHLEIQYLDEPIDIDSMAHDLTEILESDGIHPDVLKDLRVAFLGTETMLRVSASYLSYLVERIAALRPSVAFHARGRGEELRNVWVREFEGGEATFSEGSFL